MQISRLGHGWFLLVAGLGGWLGWGCALPLPDASDAGLDAGASIDCAAGYQAAPTDAGDSALCAVPKVSCRAADQVLAVSHCHYPPSPSPAVACCDPLPACAPSDCDCLMRNGPWIDAALAADAGTNLIDYQGSKRKCSGELSCTPGADGGVAVLSCSPA